MPKFIGEIDYERMLTDFNYYMEVCIKLHIMDHTIDVNQVNIAILRKFGIEIN